MHLPGRRAGSFSEDRPLGWDPVAEGDRAGDGMACNNSDRCQWQKQEAVVGAVASKPRVPIKARSGCWEPQLEFVSEEKAAGLSPCPSCSKAANALYYKHNNCTGFPVRSEG